MNHDHQHTGGSHPEQQPPVPPVQDPKDLYLRGGLTVLIIIAVIYLLTSHWLHVLDALPYVFVVGMLGMHLFGHGGHGGHGGHDGTAERRAGNGN
ncbi:DUF2933 domain-containing protein [uncultured Arthrobacter sp.]|uniref:DUF2933 domain-containing protein n=1 Tax=uncultured Arthrobacter sp. TaxID=114050 RepID=UPI0032174F5F